MKQEVASRTMKTHDVWNSVDDIVQALNLGPVNLFAWCWIDTASTSHGLWSILRSILRLILR